VRTVIVLLAVSLVTPSCDTSTKEASPQSQQSQLFSHKDPRGKLEHMSVTYTEHAFVESARNGNTTTVALFLDAGMNPDVKDSNGQTALIAAATAGHIEVVRLLLDKGAQVDSLGSQLLQDAATKGQTNLVQILIEKGVDANAQDGVGYTALKGADATITDTNGATALAAAQKSGNPATVQLLEHTAAR
jgi:ankyrin repeat protein